MLVFHKKYSRFHRAEMSLWTVDPGGGNRLAKGVNHMQNFAYLCVSGHISRQRAHDWHQVLVGTCNFYNDSTSVIIHPSLQRRVFWGTLPCVMWEMAPQRDVLNVKSTWEALFANFSLFSGEIPLVLLWNSSFISFLFTLSLLTFLKV